MEKIRLSYAPLYNAGDLLNKDLVEKLSGKQVVCSKMYDADMIAIGGALVGLQYGKSAKRRLCQKALKLIYGKKPLYVWGSGFFKNDNDNGFYRTNLKVCALRGALTQEKLSGLTGEKYDVPLADAGLLSNLFADENPEKEFEVGIIPHFSQKNEPRFQALKDSFSSACIIDIQQEPDVVINQIARCRYILSSSLHGLIFADGLGIPNLHILGELTLKGGNFKFEDYYSSFGVADEPWILENGFPTVADIVRSYKIDFKAVQEKQAQLIACFPKI
jgi:hypothetical protein